MFINSHAQKRLFGLAMVFLLTACNTTSNRELAQDSHMSQSNQLRTKTNQREASNAPAYAEATNNNLRLGKNQSQVTETKGSAKAISSFQVSGGIAARSKNKAWTASVNWAQQGASNYEIRLMGPIGSGSILIERHGGVVSFKDGAKKASSSNADQLLMQQTGIRMPVSNLYYWVRGLPAPGAVSAEKRDTANHLEYLQQAGYTITFANYTATPRGMVPTHIKLQGQGVSMKFVIKRWQV